MTRTSARAKKTKQDVNKKKEEAKLQDHQTDSEGAGESTDKENDTGSANYDVEKITHTRIYKGKRQYLVRWKGFSEDSDTWETESALQNCRDILDAFKKENLAEANSDDELGEEEEEKKRTKGKKVGKSFKKNTKKSSKSSKLKVENEDSEIEGPEEEESKGDVKDKSSKEAEESDAENEKKSKKKGSKDNKRKSVKETSKSSKLKVENEDSEIEGSEEEESKGDVKDKSSKEAEESDAENEKKSKKKGSKDNKRKSVKETDSSKAKKAKKDESDDESVTDGKDYEVEKILEVHTRKDGSREFLIRWKGYRPSDDTWEPEAHLDCQDLIDKFMEKVDKAKEASTKELRQRKETKRFVPLNSKRVSQRNSGLRPCYQESYED